MGVGVASSALVSVPIARRRAVLEGVLEASSVSTSLVIVMKKKSASAIRLRGSTACRPRHAASRFPCWPSRTFTLPACAAASVLSQVPQQSIRARCPTSADRFPRDRFFVLEAEGALWRLFGVHMPDGAWYPFGELLGGRVLREFHSLRLNLISK